MYNVAVCDDTEEERLQAAEYAGRFFEREGIEVRIDTYAAGRELLESGREYDLYLLDVLMPGMSGIDTAQALAEDKDHPVVVFITSSLESAVEGYRVEAAGFILKPVEEENFWSTMERVVRRRLGVKKAVLSVVHNRARLWTTDKTAFFTPSLRLTTRSMVDQKFSSSTGFKINPAASTRYPSTADSRDDVINTTTG